MTRHSFIKDALTKLNHLRQSLYEDNHGKDVTLIDGSVFLLLV